MDHHWIEDWLSSRAESPKTRIEYLKAITAFAEFCQSRGLNFYEVVELWRAAHYIGAREEQKFVDEWHDLIRAYTTSIKPRYAPLSQKVFLTVPKSFFSFWKIPINVELPRHPCVRYHNQDLQKEQIRMILSKASQRDHVIFLTMAESGLRANTIVNLRWWQIRNDYEKDFIPLRILTPSETLKDHVGDRWSFIGEDGVKALREYLKPRLPLKSEDYVFASEKPGRTKGEQFTEASISTIFRRITQHLKMEKGSPYGKPGHYRMHGLRKYFRNNMKAEQSLIEFWMGHSLGVDAHYISRDPEVHRAAYKKGYEQLRILEPVTPAQLKGINDQLREKDQEIQKIREEFEKRVAKLNEEVVAGRLMAEQMSKIGEAVKMWQEEKGKLEAKIAGVENFQKLILDQPDEVVLEFIKDVRRQLRE